MLLCYSDSCPIYTRRSLLPESDKRVVISHFYEAVRSRMIDDVVKASTSKATSVRREVKRFKGGFLMSQFSSSSDWEYKAITRCVVISVRAA